MAKTDSPLQLIRSMCAVVQLNIQVLRGPLSGFSSAYVQVNIQLPLHKAFQCHLQMF